MLAKELLADLGTAQGHHCGLGLYLLRCRQPERGQGPCSRRSLDVTPYRQAHPTTRHKHAMYLSDGRWSGPPDPPETGDNRERRGIPRELVHVANQDVGVWVPV